MEAVVMKMLSKTASMVNTSLNVSCDKMVKMISMVKNKTASIVNTSRNVSCGWSRWSLWWLVLSKMLTQYLSEGQMWMIMMVTVWSKMLTQYIGRKHGMLKMPYNRSFAKLAFLHVFEAFTFKINWIWILWEISEIVEEGEGNGHTIYLSFILHA